MMKKVITSLQNPLVKHLVRLRQDRHYRCEQNSFVIEGSKLIQEAASKIKKLFHLSSVQLPYLEISEKWEVTEAVMKKISGMSSPEGVLAEVQMPAMTSLNGLQFVIALDGINDPGNLGTLLRTALALGWEGAYILPTSCDPYNEKAIRSARGAHFKLPMAYGTAEELHRLVQQNGWQPLVADLSGISLEAIEKQKGILLVLGNEAHGASLAVEQFCSKVTIPMSGEIESLNVAIAGGILMYVLKR